MRKRETIYLAAVVAVSTVAVLMYYTQAEHVASGLTRHLTTAVSGGLISTLSLDELIELIASEEESTDG